jgi:hypothetical protein
MKTIDFTEYKLFESLLEISKGDLYIDLHNDYNFISITYLLDRNALELMLQHVSDKSDQILVCFENVEFIEMSITKNVDMTFDNFHRGKFEFDNKLYDNYLGKRCFYLEFYDDGKLSLLAEKAYFKLQRS